MTDTFPVDWTEAMLGSLASNEKGALTIGPFGSNLKVSDYVDAGVPLVFVRDIRARRFGGAGTKFVLPRKAEELKAHIVRSGDLLVTKMGDPPGDTAVYPDDRPPAVITADCIKMTVDERASSAQFLAYWLRAPLMREAIFEEAQGVAQQKLSLARFREIRVPLPPLDQQRRIVEKIEALTAKSRRAKDALDAIPPLLERFRQSVLAAAFRGDLTKDWREQNPDVERADRLLARIRRERRASWEQAELEQLRGKGKAPSNDAWKAKYAEPESVDREGLPDLPNGWVWASLDELVYDGPRNGYSPPCTEGGDGPLVLKLSATTQGSMVLSPKELKRATSPVAPTLDCWLRDGDVLIQRANSLELLGATAIFYGPADTYVYPDLMMRVRIADDALRSLVWRYLNGRVARSFFRSRATGTAGNMPKINSTTVRCLPVPVSPPESGNFSSVG